MRNHSIIVLILCLLGLSTTSLANVPSCEPAVVGHAGYISASIELIQETPVEIFRLKADGLHINSNLICYGDSGECVGFTSSLIVTGKLFRNSEQTLVGFMITSHGEPEGSVIFSCIQ